MITVNMVESVIMKFLKAITKEGSTEYFNTQNSSHEWEIPHTSLGGGCHVVTGEGLASNKKTSHANPLVANDQLTCHPALDAGSHEPQTPACCTPPNLPIWGGTTPLQKERRCELCLA